MQIAVSITADARRWKVGVTWHRAGESVTKIFGAIKLDFSPWLGPDTGETQPDTEPDPDLVAGQLDGLPAVTERVAALGRVGLQPGDLVIFGRWLFASVLAPVWNSIIAETSSKGQLIEVALYLPSDDASGLQSVPWELLHDGNDFLVTHRDLVVAITRRISSPSSAPSPIAPPARVLFAIGAELSDPDVSAGAEFLGLMREVERSGLKIASYIVEKASRGRLEEAVRQFKPDVVHFIAHGERTSIGVPVLLLRPEDDFLGADPERVTAEQIFACVSAAPTIPSMVVLAACESGAVSSIHGMPIAEELVRRGIPVAVAMAGSVADQACRLFTRRFGAVMAKGGSLLQAAADARLAAYRRGSGPPSMTIDWALPSVFLSDQVPHDYQPVARTEETSVSRRIQKYGFTEGPVFCGRSAFFTRYDELMSAGPRNVLAIYTAGNVGGLGKTRILREYGTRALLDGHVPCVVGLDGTDRPTDARRFAERMLWSVVQSRRLFQLPPQAGIPALLRLLISDGPVVTTLPAAWRQWRLVTTDAIAQARELGLPPDHETLAAAITADLAALIEDARAGDDPRVGPDSRVLILLDTVEEWGDTVELLVPGILTQHGLGDEDEEMPVVMAFRAGAGAHDALFQGLIEFADRDGWLDASELEPLAAGDEEALAYRWILLNANPQVAPPTSGRIYTVTKPNGQWQGILRLATDRIPAKLSQQKFYAAAKILLDMQELAAGDDDDALEMLLGSRP